MERKSTLLKALSMLMMGADRVDILVLVDVAEMFVEQKFDCGVGEAAADVTLVSIG